MATAKKAAAPAAPKKVAPAKKAAVKATISVANVPITKAPAAKGRGRSQQSWSYTGKKLSETTKSTPQFRGLVEGLEEGSDQGKWKTPFTMKDLVDYCVVEGFVIGYFEIAISHWPSFTESHQIPLTNNCIC
jgi:hypothetical protein